MEFASVPSENRLREWISRYSDDVLRTCFVLLSDQSLAEDAMQDTFTKAWKNMSQFEGREKRFAQDVADAHCRQYLQGLPPHAMAASQEPDQPD